MRYSRMASTMANGWTLKAQLLAVAAAAVLGLIFGIGAGNAQAQGRFGGRTRPAQDFDRTQLQADIIFSGPNQRPVHGIRCATRPVSRLEIDLMNAELRAWRRQQQRFEPRQVGIPVAFHVLTDAGQGDVSNAQIDEQIAVLNDAYAPQGFSFSLSSVDRTDNSSWYNGCAGGQESAMKGALAIDTATTLNIYTCEPSDGILGYAYLPGDVAAGDTDDGVVLLHSSLPGGDAAPYNEGDTGTHEVGHYLGLLHTFDGGCDGDGDLVADTPDEADPAYGCPTGRDSCSGEGLDPIENFMDYTDDACMDQFTSLQGARMSDLTAMHRPDLGNGGGSSGGGGGDGGGDDSAPGAPSLVSPNGSISETSPTYTWTPASGNGLNRYQVQVNEAGGGTAYDDGYDPAACDGGSCSVTPAVSLSDGNYVWQVRAQNDVGWGSWSSEMAFTVNTSGGGGNGGGDGGGNDLPAAPSLVSPSGTIDQVSPTYTWAPVNASGLNRYQLQVTRDGSGVVYDDGLDPGSCNPDSCSATPGLELDDGDYTWHVRAQSSAGWGGWSSDFFFTVAASGGDGGGNGGGSDGDGGNGGGGSDETAPQAPTLLSPAGAISELRPTFTWAPLSTDNGWIFYELRVLDEDGRVAYEDFSDSFQCNASSCSLRAYMRIDDGSYSWQLRGENDFGWSDWSAAMAFSIGTGGGSSGGPPTAPSLNSPSGRTSNRRPTFDWNASDGAMQYQVQVNKRWWGIVHNQMYAAAANCAGSRCSFVPANNVPTGRYTWRVRARNGSGWSAWSDRMAFKVR